MNGGTIMTNESKAVLLRCKLYSLKNGLKNAIANGSSKDIIHNWKVSCEETQEKIIELDS